MAGVQMSGGFPISATGIPLEFAMFRYQYSPSSERQPIQLYGRATWRLLRNLTDTTLTVDDAGLYVQAHCYD